MSSRSLSAKSISVSSKISSAAAAAAAEGDSSMINLLLMGAAVVIIVLLLIYIYNNFVHKQHTKNEYFADEEALCRHGMVGSRCRHCNNES